MRKGEYSTETIRKRLDLLGLPVDEEMLEVFGNHCQLNDYSQKEFEALVMLHIDAIIRIFTRESYTLWDRIKIALYWLGVGRGIGQ